MPSFYIRLWRSWITQQIPILKNGGSNPFGRAITIRLHRKMQPYFFCSTKPKGFEQGVKKQSGRLFFSRGNERSEAIGTAVPRQNPFGRAMIVLL